MAVEMMIIAGGTSLLASLNVGTFVGATVGSGVGSLLGASVGSGVGFFVGLFVGDDVGALVTNLMLSVASAAKAGLTSAIEEATSLRLSAEAYSSAISTAPLASSTICNAPTFITYEVLASNLLVAFAVAVMLHSVQIWLQPMSWEIVIHTLSEASANWAGVMGTFDDILASNNVTGSGKAGGASPFAVTLQLAAIRPCVVTLQKGLNLA